MDIKIRVLPHIEHKPTWKASSNGTHAPKDFDAVILWVNTKCIIVTLQPALQGFKIEVFSVQLVLLDSLNKNCFQFCQQKLKANLHQFSELSCSFQQQEVDNGQSANTGSPKSSLLDAWPLLTHKLEMPFLSLTIVPKTAAQQPQILANTPWLVLLYKIPLNFNIWWDKPICQPFIEIDTWYEIVRKWARNRVQTSKKYPTIL